MLLFAVISVQISAAASTKSRKRRSGQLKQVKVEKCGGESTIRIRLGPTYFTLAHNVYTLAPKATLLGYLTKYMSEILSIVTGLEILRPAALHKHRLNSVYKFRSTQ